MIVSEYMRYLLAGGFEWTEFSWVLEDNRPLRMIMEHFGAELYKRYRIYEKPIG